MKKLLTIVGQAVFSLACGLVCAIVCIKFNIGYWAAPFVAWFGGCMLGALVSGLFDISERKERTMHNTLSQGYRDAA